jgi:glycosyltransferase involved in cell wall biosynthesis
VRGLLEETWLSRTSDPAAADSDFYRLTRAAESDVMRAADAVVTLSAALRDEIAGRGVPAERIHVVPNGVDDAWLEPTEPAVRRAENVLRVGIGGTLNAYEGVHVLVDAVALLRAQGTEVRLLVVGDGPARSDLEKQVGERGIADVTTFTGVLPRTSVIAAYRDLDVFCLPRLDLPVTRLVPPLKPLEAMALGVPVVASDLPPLREIVGADRGVLVAPADPAALAAGIQRLARGEVRRELGDSAHAWVAATRTWPTAAATYQHIYASIRGETP